MIENGIAWLAGYRTKRQILTVSMVNCITNPALNLLLLILASRGVDVGLAVILPLEVGVVLLEWWLFRLTLTGSARRLLALSLTANTVSFLAGVLIFW